MAKQIIEGGFKLRLMVWPREMAIGWEKVIGWREGAINRGGGFRTRLA